MQTCERKFPLIPSCHPQHSHPHLTNAHLTLPTHPAPPSSHPFSRPTCTSSSSKQTNY